MFLVPFCAHVCFLKCSPAMIPIFYLTLWIAITSYITASHKWPEPTTRVMEGFSLYLCIWQKSFFEPKLIFFQKKGKTLSLWLLGGAERTARGQWASSELLEITWAHLAIIGLLLKTRPSSNYASANGRQKTELWLRNVTMTRQCHGSDCGFFWVQACWWFCHIPAGEAIPENRISGRRQRDFLLLNWISPVIFSDTRNKIITCFGSTFCTLHHTKSVRWSESQRHNGWRVFPCYRVFQLPQRQRRQSIQMFAPCHTELWTSSFSVSGMQIFFHSLAVFFGFQHSELTLSWIPRPPQNQMDERNWEKEPTLFEKGMNFSLCI